jgi:hypothetical protein
MKLTRISLLALLTLGAAGAASAQTSLSAGIQIGSSGRASVDLGFFYDDLASYGNWIERPNYGWVWTPRDVSSNWRPYQDGHWVWTDDGWTWLTDESYGWATYHYGRWYQDPEIGWSWVPGQDWAPAWVSWQEGSNYIGWAALPPGVNYSASYGGGYGNYAYGIAPTTYVFVEERNFLAPRVVDYVVPQTRAVTVFRDTRNITTYRSVNNRIFNQGVQVDRIQQVVGRPVQRYQLADLGASSGGHRAQVQGNRVAFFRPQVQKTANVQPPSARPVARKAVVDASQFRASHPDRAGRAQAAGAQPQASRPAVQPRPNQDQGYQRQGRQGQGTQVQGSQNQGSQNQGNQGQRPVRQPRTQTGQGQSQTPAAQPQQQPRQPRQPRQPQARQPEVQQQQQPPQARQRQPRTQAPDQQPPQRQRPPQAEPQPQRQQRPPQAEPQPQRQQRPPQAAPQRQPPPENQKKRREPPPPPPR